MGIFSRTRDIIAANFNELLDQADDPAKMIRMIILEMEETLVEVRASAARTIADQKEMHRHTVKLDRLQADWGEKAQLALCKDREDLARAALVEKKKAADMGDQLKAGDRGARRCAARLRGRHPEAAEPPARSAQPPDPDRRAARERREPGQAAHAAGDRAGRRGDGPLRPARTPGRLCRGPRRCDEHRRRHGPPSLADEIAALEGSDKIDEELEEMKRALGMGDDDDSKGA